MNELKIEYLPVDSLTPYDGNARKHANCPFVQVCLETLLLPVTTFVMKKVKKVEQKNISNACES